METEASSSSSHAEPINAPPLPIRPTDPPLSVNHDADSSVRIIDPNSFSELGVLEKKSSVKMRKKRRVFVNGVHQPSTSTASASSKLVGVRRMSMRRNPRIDLGSNSHRRSEVDALALPLGMSIGAVFAQVLDERDIPDSSAYVDNLSEMCTSAVKEALDNVFGDRFDCFVVNFEKSFRSTLRTIRLINESSVTKERSHQPSQKKMRISCANETVQTSDNCISGPSTRSTKGRVSEIAPSFDESEECCTYIPRNSRNLELELHQQTRQDLVCANPIRKVASIDSSMVGTFKKSVLEQTRANDLKAYEISLLMEKLKLKETKLAIDSESNYLDRFKLSMGLSKASFKAEKFKTQLEDTRHAELLQSCIDSLVGSLLITSCSLMYGAYIHSYTRLTEATASCMPSKTSTSWWVPKSFGTVTSGFQMISCQVQVLSRMMFGVLMILAITYLLLQRAAGPRQSMPITFILLILGGACGISGKLCVDTLGGDGYIWLLLWEALCSIHFIGNMFTSTLFSFLYGPIKFNLNTKRSTAYYYLSRRVVFYAVILFILPLTCGLIPFASAAVWKDHFFALAANFFVS